MPTDDPHTTTDDRIAALDQQITALNKRITALETTIEDLTAADTTAEGTTPVSTQAGAAGETDPPDGRYDPTLNRRQRAIIDAIAARGETRYSRNDLESAVRSTTDVSARNTVTAYMRALGESAHFEQVGTQVWEFTGMLDR